MTLFFYDEVHFCKLNAKSLAREKMFSKKYFFQLMETRFSTLYKVT